MKLTKSKLKHLIKEMLQNEGMMDFFNKKEETREERLYRLTKEDFMNEFGGEDIFNALAPEVKESAEKDLQSLVDEMLADPRRGGPRDKFERRIKQLAIQYRR